MLTINFVIVKLLRDFVFLITVINCAYTAGVASVTSAVVTIPVDLPSSFAFLERILMAFIIIY